MRIPRRPKELSTSLREHAELVDKPVFHYRFPTPEEEAEQLIAAVGRFIADPEVMERISTIEDKKQRAEEVQRMMAEGEVQTNTAFGRYLCELFDTFIARIDGLVIADEPFDREHHLGEIPGDWKVEVGTEIRNRVAGYLTELEVGNSSLPSNSVEETETTATDPSTADAAGDAS